MPRDVCRWLGARTRSVRYKNFSDSAPGLVPGLAAVAVLMITYGGFLFSFALHPQAGLGDSALRAGLTFAPCALVFGVCGYFWRRLPASWHHLLAPVGCLVAMGGYLAVASVLRSGGPGGVLLQTGLVVTGAALALGFSPLVTHALVRVPMRQAADASGLLTTTIQLGQAVGVATFGSLLAEMERLCSSRGDLWRLRREEV